MCSVGFLPLKERYARRNSLAVFKASFGSTSSGSLLDPSGSGEVSSEEEGGGLFKAEGGASFSGSPCPVRLAIPYQIPPRMREITAAPIRYFCLLVMLPLLFLRFDQKDRTIFLFLRWFRLQTRRIFMVFEDRKSVV